MTHPVNCPNCGINWYEDRTITEYFHDKYKKEGIPSYIIENGISDPMEAAMSTSEMYGCTPSSPRHFGINVIGIENNDYDGVSLWECTNCGIEVNRFTNKVIKKGKKKRKSK